MYVYVLLMWHCRLEKTAEHHTTHLAFPDLASYYPHRRICDQRTMID